MNGFGICTTACARKRPIFTGSGFLSGAPACAIRVRWGADQVRDFPTFLADKRKVSASTPRVALSALLFLYQKVLCVDLPWLDRLARPSVPRRLPVVLTREEVARILALLSGDHAVLGRLLYGTGMRITEALQLRVKAVDFDHRASVIGEGKGFKDRVVMLPQALIEPLKQQMANALSSGRCNKRGP